MITDAMLAAAAEEVAAAMVSAVPEMEHTFSERFERRLRRLARRAEHPVRYQVLRYAAAVLIAVFTLFGVLMLSSPTVRAAIVEWVEVIFEGYVRYAPPAKMPDHVNCEYRLNEIPDGFTHYSTVDLGDGVLDGYIDENGSLFWFGFERGDPTDTFYLIDIEGDIHYTAKVGEAVADIYISVKENGGSAIIWTDPETNYVLTILADATYEELIAYAQKVERINFSEKTKIQCHKTPP